MEKSRRWRELCAQAAMEGDPKRLLELVAEITRLFDEERANRTMPLRIRKLLEPHFALNFLPSNTDPYLK